MGATQAVGSKPGISAARTDRQSSTAKPVTGPIALCPPSSASRNASFEWPSAETTPIPETNTRCIEGRTLSSEVMAVQRAWRSSRSAPRALVRVAWVSTLAAVLASTSSQAQQQPEALSGRAAQSFDQMYEQGQRLNATMKTLTARFTETTTSSLLVRPLLARGTVLVERPARVALRYSEPDSRVIVIDNKMLTSSWPTTRTLDIATSMSRVQKQFIDGSAADLRREFDI